MRSVVLALVVTGLLCACGGGGGGGDPVPPQNYRELIVGQWEFLDGEYLERATGTVYGVSDGFRPESVQDPSAADVVLTSPASSVSLLFTST